MPEFRALVLREESGQVVPRIDAVDEVGPAAVEHVVVVCAVEPGGGRELVSRLAMGDGTEENDDVAEPFHLQGTKTVSPGTSGSAGALPASTSRASTL